MVKLNLIHEEEFGEHLTCYFKTYYLGRKIIAAKECGGYGFIIEHLTYRYDIKQLKLSTKTYNYILKHEIFHKY